MKRISTIILAIIASACINSIKAETVLKADTVKIGTGTDPTYNAPFCNFYRNSWNQCIYSASDINHKEGYILAISYNCATSVLGYSVSALDIYMAKCANTSFEGNSDWSPAESLTKVYSATNKTVGNKTGWETFNLSTPYLYKKGDNLAVVVSKTSSSYSNSLKYYCTSTSQIKTCLYRESDSNTSYASHPGNNTGSALFNRPNIQLLFGNNVLVDDIYYDVIDINPRKVVVSNNKSNTADSLSIPESINILGQTYAVTAIADSAFLNNTSLKYIEIPSTIGTIGKHAFYGCSALKEVSMNSTTPPAMTSSSTHPQFGNCTKLKHIFVSEATYASFVASSGWSSYEQKIVPKTFTINVTSDTVATGFSVYNLVVPSGVKVYSYSYDTFSKVLVPSGEPKTEGFIIPAGSGFVLKAAAGNHIFDVTFSNAGEFESSLTGYKSNKATSEIGGTVFALGKKNGKFAFYKYAGQNVSGGKAIFVRSDN